MCLRSVKVKRSEITKEPMFYSSKHPERYRLKRKFTPHYSIIPTVCVDYCPPFRSRFIPNASFLGRLSTRCWSIAVGICVHYTALYWYQDVMEVCGVVGVPVHIKGVQWGWVRAQVLPLHTSLTMSSWSSGSLCTDSLSYSSVLPTQTHRRPQSSYPTIASPNCFRNLEANHFLEYFFCISNFPSRTNGPSSDLDPIDVYLGWTRMLTALLFNTWPNYCSCGF